MAADRLARLARLRAIEERTATLELARRLAAEAAARTEAADAADAIPREAQAAGPTDFARWLPRALASQARAAAQARIAAQRVDGARAAMLQAHQARTLVEEARQAARRAAMAEAERRAQHLMDDLSLRRR